MKKIRLLDEQNQALVSDPGIPDESVQTLHQLLRNLIEEFGTVKSCKPRRNKGKTGGDQSPPV